jgi:hypothetical protein
MLRYRPRGPWIDGAALLLIYALVAGVAFAFA